MTPAQHRAELIERLMERRFKTQTALVSDLLMRTLLWRMRRYCDDGQPEKADVLAELLPKDIVVSFYDWYYGTDETGPVRIGRHA